MINRKLLVMLVASAAGCGIPKEQFDAKALEAQQLNQKVKDEQGKV